MKPTRFLLLLLATLVASVRASAAELPDYLAAALARFSADAPPGWAYTLTTTRGNATSVERYDPSRPKGGEWTLLQSQGRAPTADELQRYNRYKASNPPPTSRANFAKGDLDLGTFTLVRENGDRAEFQGRFRTDTSEPLLRHVVLTLVVDRTVPAIERTVMKLVTPFSPALGVRMAELEVTMDFRAVEDSAVMLPQAAHSRFRGRMFFLVPLNEELRIEYSDYTRVTPTRP